MKLENDCSPSKLFLCQVIYFTYGSYTEFRSERCQQLVLQMHHEEAFSLKDYEARYLSKLRDGWEPTKSECMTFFSEFSIVSEAIDEWYNQIEDTHSFITWMSQLQQWRQLYPEDEVPEEDKELLFFVSYVLASFSLCALDVCSVIASRVLRFFEGQDSGSKFGLFSPYYHSFSQEQRDSWIQETQKVLYQHLGEYDIDEVQTYFESISPPPAYLLATLAILRHDYSQAEQLLMESTPPLFTLIPLIQYFISNGEETMAKCYLDQLALLIRISKKPEYEAWLSFLQFTATLDPSYLNFQFTDPSLRWYVVFTVLKLALIHPSILISLPSSIKDDVDSLLDNVSDVSLEGALNWLETSANYGEMLRSLIVNHPEVESLLSAEDRMFVEFHESEGNEDLTELLKRCKYYKIPFLILRKCSRQVIFDVLHEDIEKFYCDLMKWRQKKDVLPMTKNDRTIESIFSALCEGVMWSKQQQGIKSIEAVLEAKQICEKNHFEFWESVCNLVLYVVLINQEKSVLDGGKRALGALPLFMKLRLKHLVQLTVGVVSVVQGRNDLIEELTSVLNQEGDIATWLKTVDYPLYIVCCFILFFWVFCIFSAEIPVCTIITVWVVLTS